MRKLLLRVVPLLALAVFFSAARVSAFQNFVVNGTTYPFPDVDDTDWGQNVTDWAGAMTAGVLQKQGGDFFLRNELNFGTTFGLRTPYLVSASTVTASTGAVRLAAGDVINWRTLGSTNTLSLGIDSNGRLTYNGTPISTSTGGGISSITGYSGGAFQGNFNTINFTGNASLAISGTTATVTATGGGGGTTLTQSTFPIQMVKDFEVYLTTVDFIGTGLKYTVLNASMTLLDCKCFTAYSSTAGSTFFEIAKTTLNALDASTFSIISPTVEVSTSNTTAIKVSSGIAFAANTTINYGESFSVHIKKVPSSGIAPRNFGCSLTVVGELVALAGTPSTGTGTSVNTQVYLDTGALQAAFTLQRTTADTNAAQIANSTGTFRTEYEVHHATADSKFAQLAITTPTLYLVGSSPTFSSPPVFFSSITARGGISVSSFTTIKSSMSVMDVVTSTVGFQAPSSTFGVVNTSTITFPQWSLVPSTQPTAGQHLIVGKVVGTNVYLEGGGDGGGGGGGSGDVVLASTQTFTGKNTFINQVTVSSNAFVSGNFGVGTLSPAFPLQVYKPQNAASQIDITNDNGGDSALSQFVAHVEGGIAVAFSAWSNAYAAIPGYAGFATVEGNTAANGLILGSPGTGPIYFRLGGRALSDTKMTLANSGLVGIGTTNPGVLLDVVGGSIRSSGGIAASGSIGAGTLNPSSLLDVVGGSITVRGTGAGLIVRSGTMTVVGDNGYAAIAVGSSSVKVPTVPGFAFFYSSDTTAGNTEMWVSDGQGNKTQISPHDENGDWQYFSVNERTGKVVRIKMEELVADVEKITGKRYRYDH